MVPPILKIFALTQFLLQEFFPFYPHAVLKTVDCKMETVPNVIKQRNSRAHSSSLALDKKRRYGSLQSGGSESVHGMKMIRGLLMEGKTRSDSKAEGYR